MTPTIEINGRTDRGRHLVQVNNQAVYLTRVQFRILTVLALERARLDGTADGWVSGRELVYPHTNTGRYVDLLRDTITAGISGLGDWPIIKGTNRGMYRLCVEPEAISFPDIPTLVAIGELEITLRLRGPRRVKLPT